VLGISYSLVKLFEQLVEGRKDAVLGRRTADGHNSRRGVELDDPGPVSCPHIVTASRETRGLRRLYFVLTKVEFEMWSALDLRTSFMVFELCRGRRLLAGQMRR
jgi:hypothetical protein